MRLLNINMQSGKLVLPVVQTFKLVHRQAYVPGTAPCSQHPLDEPLMHAQQQGWLVHSDEQAEPPA